MTEEAKALLRSLVVRFAIPCDLRAGVIEALHKASLVPEYAALVETLRRCFGYDRMRLLDRDETIAATGSERFFGAVHDGGGGHLDPYRLALGLAKAAAAAGATLHERTPAVELRDEGGPLVRTAGGDIRAASVIVATDGRSGGFETETRRRMLGVNSFVVATEPLGAEGDAILPGGESAADSRFVVRYWRRTADGRLIFGGGESSAGYVPADIASFVRPHLAEIYPALAGVPIAHAWGGVVSVTASRLPFVREIAPNVLTAGGYSGQGVALAPFLGKVLAEAALGRRERFEAFAALPIPPLPLLTAARRTLVRLALLRGRIADRF
jgi:gamma-glutamylputrescine oxidase